jgi:hypothetical protein
MEENKDEDTKSTLVGRLALRQEGTLWNAYYALPETMEGAIFLGSIKIGAVTGNPDRKEAFASLMWGIVAEIIEEKTGCKPECALLETAPESERAGNS